MDEYKYAVLYRKQVYVENSSYIFIPCYVIKGIYDEKEGVFLDELNGEFYSYSDINIINQASDYCIGKVYSKEELIKKYKDSYENNDIYEYQDINEETLKISLFKESQRNITIGYYNETSTDIYICNIGIVYSNNNADYNKDTSNYYDNLKQIFGEDISIFLPDDISYIKAVTDIEKLKKYIEKIMFSKDKYNEKLSDLDEQIEVIIIQDFILDDMLNMNDVKEIKDTFNKIVSKNKVNNKNDYLDIETIKKAIETSYNEIQNSKDLTEISEVLKKLVYVDLSVINYLYVKELKGIRLPKSMAYFKKQLGEIYFMENIFNIDDLKSVHKVFYSGYEKELTELSCEFKVLNEQSNNKNVQDINEVSDAIDKAMSKINNLVGLNNVKEEMEELFATILYKVRTKDNLRFDNQTKHMVFTGNPGTGKTTVASIIAPLLHKLDYLENDKVAFVAAQDLIAGYVGQTAIKTEALIKKNRGGLIVLDEAYILAGEAQQFGNEAVTVILKEMEQNNTMFIFAGYTKEMESFIKMNSGLESRIGTYLEFKDYNDKELLEIFIKNFENVNLSNSSNNQLKISMEGLDKVKCILHEAKSVENFGNGRFAKKLFDSIIRNHAKNVRKPYDEASLYMLTEEDIPDNIDKLFFNGGRSTELYSGTGIGFNAEISGKGKAYTKAKHSVRRLGN